MPTPRFNNLPQGKRDIILAAIKKEFSRVSYAETSINKIIEDAEISRGSFYTYFVDKKDVLYYLLSEYFTRIHCKAVSTLEQTDGDIFALFIEMFDYTIEYNSKERDLGIVLKNLFISLRSDTLRPDTEIDMKEIMNFSKEKAGVQELIKLVNTQSLNAVCSENLEDLFSILFSVTKYAITHSLDNISNAPAIRTRFINKINIIKYGALKR